MLSRIDEKILAELDVTANRIIKFQELNNIMHKISMKNK